MGLIRVKLPTSIVGDLQFLNSHVFTKVAVERMSEYRSKSKSIGDIYLFKLKFLLNFPAGLAIGSIATFSLAMFMNSDFSKNATESYTSWLPAGITLITAAVALAGVFATLNHQFELSEENRIRRLNASKATLPAALSELSQICRTGILASFNGKDEKQSNESDALITKLTLSSKTASALTSVIENADPQISQSLSSILADHQINLSRCIGRMEQKYTSSASDRADTQIYWAYLSCRVGMCYDYARGGNWINNQLTTDEILNAIVFIDKKFHKSDVHITSAEVFIENHRLVNS